MDAWTVLDHYRTRWRRRTTPVAKLRRWGLLLGHRRIHGLLTGSIVLDRTATPLLWATTSRPRHSVLSRCVIPPAALVVTSSLSSWNWLAGFLRELATWISGWKVSSSSRDWNGLIVVLLKVSWRSYLDISSLSGCYARPKDSRWWVLRSIALLQLLGSCPFAFFFSELDASSGEGQGGLEWVYVKTIWVSGYRRRLQLASGRQVIFPAARNWSELRPIARIVLGIDAGQAIELSNRSGWLVKMFSRHTKFGNGSSLANHFRSIGNMVNGLIVGWNYSGTPAEVWLTMTNCGNFAVGFWASGHYASQ